MEIEMEKAFLLLTTLSTVAIAVLAYCNFKLSKRIDATNKQHQVEIQEANKQHQAEIQDLYQAIVISNIVSRLPTGNHINNTNSALATLVEKFNECYQGNLKIFNNTKS